MNGRRGEGGGIANIEPLGQNKRRGNSEGERDDEGKVEGGRGGRAK